eukprot:gi/632955998/ref/XP_007893742.1/ PREDICTED: RAB6-interacting golgin [Callorhinchus milii]
MAGWAGFSDEELRRIKHLKDPSNSEMPDRARRAPASKSQQLLQKERALQQHRLRAAEHDGGPSALPEQQLSKPKMKPPHVTVIQTPPPSSKMGQKQTSEKEQNDTEVHHQDKRLGGNVEGRAQDSSVKETTEQVKEMPKGMELRERSCLEHLQLEQRFMEEKNKRKKALLSKAIAERSKRTMAETAKLKRIQKGLQTLDDLLSADVSILRDRIEQTSWEFHQAKKRFDKAEVEYVASKLNLHKKIELKEQLTEHLCTIIQQNELRKAQKLEELMQQLEVEEDEEAMELEIEVDRMLQQQQELPKESIQSNTAREESTQQTVSNADSQNQSVAQSLLGEQVVNHAVSSTAQMDLKDPDQSQEPENAQHKPLEESKTPAVAT